MAGEFILFVPICHWMAGKIAVPFKTYPSWLTACYRGKMKTSRDGGLARTPRRLNKSGDVTLLFFFPGTPTSSPSPIAQFEKKPPERALVFDWC